MPPQDIRTTIWNYDEKMVPASKEIRELLKDFQYSVQPHYQSKTQTKQTVTTTRLSLDRANKIGWQAILSLRDRDLTLETLKSLRHYSPTPQEIQAIESFEGAKTTLSTADQYVMKVMDIPRLQHRLTTMIYRRRFVDEINDLGPELGVLRSATAEVQRSSKLKRIMLYVLEFGNILNSSTFRGNAPGFEISALSKHQELDILGIILDLKVSFSEVLGAVKNMLIGMTQAKEELEIMSSNKELLGGDRFIPEMKLFIENGEPMIEALEKSTIELKNELSQMIKYLGQDAVTRAEDIFGALSTFKSSLAQAVEDVMDWEEEEVINDDALDHPKPDENINSVEILAAIYQEHKTPNRHAKDRSSASSISSARKLLFGNGGVDTAVRDSRSGGSILRTGSITTRHRHLRDEISPTRNQSPGSKIFLTK
ncbi:uncharacterized protein MELLADRAFT_64018 [Melampsora larici-populina 98AG31]|uniref:FH2 domain-containing protein n=1 Tax=Melampsora larici-populina (strain 98AG31 / pathotype 3-4-7) TaxID=747676 RepID=F4RPW0_MELLP|nr:uncharacterized protein MELLADRAFT_64018 [Melampsora larici-populina 98AG31]EGG05616.1 hypothetical protein MELLADRAFT_64018 [Melampsora larici-populina 98AG31]